MDIIDNDKKVKHSKLAEGVENAIQVKNILILCAKNSLCE